MNVNNNNPYERRSQSPDTTPPPPVLRRQENYTPLGAWNVRNGEVPTPTPTPSQSSERLPPSIRLQREQNIVQQAQPGVVYVFPTTLSTSTSTPTPTQQNARCLPHSRCVIS